MAGSFNVRASPVRATADADTPLGRPAKDRAERRAALDWCLNNVWAAADIGRVERVDTDQFHGWRMWRWKAEA
jgi:hypothetical protein